MLDDAPERMMETKEVADLLGVHPETVRRAAQAGRLIGRHISGKTGRWRFLPSSVLAFQRGETFTSSHIGPQPRKDTPCKT